MIIFTFTVNIKNVLNLSVIKKNSLCMQKVKKLIFSIFCLIKINDDLKREEKCKYVRYTLRYIETY